MQRDEFEENNEEQKAATVEQSNTWDTVLPLLSTALSGPMAGQWRDVPPRHTAIVCY
jgi:hypothetical protein